MKTRNKISVLVVLCLTALVIINAEAKKGPVSVKVDIENKTSDQTLKFNLSGKNPNWSGKEENELRVSTCSPAGCIEEPLECEKRGDCRNKYKLYFIEPGQTLKLEEEFADENVGYSIRYCEDWDMSGPLFKDHTRDVNQCNANFKMSAGKGELKAALTPMKSSMGE